MRGILALAMLCLMEAGCSQWHRAAPTPVPVAVPGGVEPRALRGLCEAGVVCIVSFSPLAEDSSKEVSPKPGAPLPVNLAYVVEVMDAEGRIVPDAQVALNGRRALFDPTTGVHQRKSPSYGALKLSVRAPGFLGFDGQTGSAIHTHRIYLPRPHDPWYLDTNGIPVAYSARPREVLVRLRDHLDGQPMDLAKATQHLLSLPELQGYSVVEVDWRAGLGPFTVNAGRNRRLLLRAPADLPAKQVRSLAALRGDRWVQWAGPLIVHGNAYGRAAALGTHVYVYPNTQVMKTYEQGAALAAQWGGEYDVQNHQIKFDASAGSVMVQATKALAASGLFSHWGMELLSDPDLY